MIPIFQMRNLKPREVYSKLPTMTWRRDSDPGVCDFQPRLRCQAALPGRTQVSWSVSVKLGSGLRLTMLSVPLYHRQQRPDRVHGDHQGWQHAPAVPGCRHLPDEFGGAWRVQAGLGSGQVRRPSAGTMAESSGSSSRLAVQTPTKVSSLRSSSNDIRATWTDYHWQKLEYLTDKSQVPFDQNPILTPFIRYQIRCFAEYVYDYNYVYCFYNS